MLPAEQGNWGRNCGAGELLILCTTFWEKAEQCFGWQRAGGEGEWLQVGQGRQNSLQILCSEQGPASAVGGNTVARQVKRTLISPADRCRAEQELRLMLSSLLIEKKSRQSLKNLHN